jgi:hypothetical protein
MTVLMTQLENKEEGEQRERESHAPENVENKGWPFRSVYRGVWVVE